MKKYTYDLIEYDVLGNNKDGFEVNNLFKTQSNIQLTEKQLESDKSLIKALKKLGLIKKGLHTKSIEITGENEYTLYFADVRKECGYFCPAFELRCVNIL